MSRKFEKYLTELNQRIEQIAPKPQPKTIPAKFRKWKNRIAPQYLKKIFRFLTMPVAIFFILNSRKIHSAYTMTLNKKLRLGYKMWRNTMKIFTGSSYRAHLLMARKILEIPPEQSGVIVECGSFKGGSAANLSLICEITGRTLIIYDSFEGLPETFDKADAHYHEGKGGILSGDLEEVRQNIKQHGHLNSCKFIKGWFHETLPEHNEKIAAMFLDVDLQSSLHDCIINLWPHLIPNGYIFLDEYMHTDYCALFYSEKYWTKYFNRLPPGLIGAGAGVPLGEFYFGPLSNKTPWESMTSIAYTQKNMESAWLYFPEENNNANTKRTI